MPDFGTHWCYTCRCFVTINGNVVCPHCNRSFIRDLNEMDEPWGPLYQRIELVMERHGPAIREAASQGQLHLADTTIDEIFNLEDSLHGLRRNDMVDSSARQEPRMDDTFDSVVSQVEEDQIDHNSNSPALPSDSLKTIRITQRHVQDDLNCSICLDKFQLGHEVRETPCKHLYHHDCIVLWLARHESCPICRFDMRQRPTWWQYAFPFLWQRSRRSSRILLDFLYYLIFSPINLITILVVCVCKSFNAL